MSKKFDNRSTGELVDELYDLRAQIKALQTLEEELKGELKDRVEDGAEVSGERATLKRTEYLSERINTAKVDKHFGGKEAAKAAGFYSISVSSRLTTTAINIYEDAA